MDSAALQQQSNHEGKQYSDGAPQERKGGQLSGLSTERSQWSTRGPCGPVPASTLGSTTTDQSLLATAHSPGVLRSFCPATLGALFFVKCLLKCLLI
jgi:hypothetical protein